MAKFNVQVFSILFVLSFILTGISVVGCTPKVEETVDESLVPSPGPSPSPSPGPSPSPSPSPSPAPAPAGWTPTAGTLADGSWNDPSVLPDATHVGAYGGIGYAPNNDLYLFYETGVYPNENLQSVIRRNASATWSAESFIGVRIRGVNMFFDGAKPYLATESGGSAQVYTSSNYTNNAPQTVTWTLEQYFQANDGNPDGFGVNGNSYLTKNGSDFQFFHTYLWYSAVTGASLWGMNLTKQSAGVWPAAGTQGTALDSTNLVPYASYPRGASGAYHDGSGRFLAFSKIALLSTDHAVNFSQIMNSGVASDDLRGVLATCQNPTDGSILVANVISGGSSSIVIWGTQDFGVTFTNLTSFSTSAPMKGAMTATNNLIFLAFSTDAGSGENLIKVVKSADGGTTWSAALTLQDVTSGGANPSYTVGSLSLTSNANGKVALSYSVVDGNAHKGAYVKEFY